MKIAITISIIAVILVITVILYKKYKNNKNTGKPILDNPNIQPGQIFPNGVPRKCNPGYKSLGIQCITAPCPDSYIDDIGPCVVF